MIIEMPLPILNHLFFISSQKAPAAPGLNFIKQNSLFPGSIIIQRRLPYSLSLLGKLIEITRTIIP